MPLFEWPEQERYEQIRPLVLFDVAVTERAQEVGTSASTLYRRLDRFSKEGMESLLMPRRPQAVDRPGVLPEPREGAPQQLAVLREPVEAWQSSVDHKVAPTETVYRADVPSHRLPSIGTTRRIACRWV